jgi:8-oxo-dGTP pyrophosphatase MutT (NUDIX family)
LTELPGDKNPGDNNPGGADAGGPNPPRPARPRHAASLLLWRHGQQGVEVLMGRRHRDMRFMPGVWVFPGGRVDRADHRAGGGPLAAETQRLLEISAAPSLARALAVCAARELHEETGLTLSQLDVLHYLTRAITPADRPIRFHARFLVAEAQHAHGTIQGSGELEEVGFVALDALSGQPTARITDMVVEEFRAWLAAPGQRPLHRIMGRDNRWPERSARLP